MNGEQVYGVAQLNQRIKTLLDSDGGLARVYVRGELSNYKIYPSGHHYFTMKEQDSSLRCVMFKASASALRFRPENGMKVVAFGRVSVYPRDGAYQLYCSALSPDGVGELHVAFEQLRSKLHQEGLFDAARKKPLPRYPMRIAVITSSAGAAVRDVIRVLGKRFPLAKVIVLPVRVQGAEAPPELCGALRYANRYKVADLIITGRGGGSIEDLWAFNDERVARAIAESEIPVISAVGHEPDVTIADYVADLRAATPSNGAELAAPDSAELSAALESASKRMRAAMRGRLPRLREAVRGLAEKPVLKSATGYIEDRRMLIDLLSGRMDAAEGRALARRKHDYVRLTAALDAMSPLKVLSRGYAIVRTESGAIVKRASDALPGERLRVRLGEGGIRCVMEGEDELG